MQRCDTIKSKILFWMKRKGELFEVKKKIWDAVRAYVPIWSLILFILFFASLILTFFVKRSVALAGALHETVGAGMRALLATLTWWIPISLAEFILIASPILITLLTIAVFRHVKRSYFHAIRFCVAALSIISVMYTLSAFGYEPGFYVESVEEKLDIQREDLSAEQLYETAMILVDEIERDLPHVSFPQKTYSAMTFSYADMNRKLNDAYDTLCDTYPDFHRLHSIGSSTFRRRSSPGSRSG